MKKLIIALLSCCFAFSSCDLIEVVVDEIKDLTNNELNLPPASSIEQFQSEEDIINMFDAANKLLCTYILKQAEIEKIFFVTKDFDSITPENSDIAELWANGYRLINIANTCLNSLEASNFLNEEALMKYRAHFNAILGFTYKNMFEHWGAVPIITQGYIVAEDIYRPEERELLEFIWERLILSSDILMDEKPEVNYLSYPSILLALSEIKHSDYSASLECCRKFKETTNTGEQVFCLCDENGVNHTIYTRKHATLLELEYSYLIGNHNGGLNSVEDIISRWDQNSYGYWAMLKRLGKLAEVVGCPEYMTNFPIPQNELMVCPNLAQNPGYQY